MRDDEESDGAGLCAEARQSGGGPVGYVVRDDEESDEAGGIDSESQLPLPLLDKCLKRLIKRRCQMTLQQLREMTKSMIEGAGT